MRRIRGGVDKKVRGATTDTNGRWQATYRRARGKFYAKVKEKTLTTGNITVICKEARSRTLRR